MIKRLASIYFQLTVGRPLATLSLVLLVIAAAIWQAQHFRLDASSDSLLLEDDQDLEYYETIRNRYGSDDLLIVTYTPDGDLFSDVVLDDIAMLRDELAALPRIREVTTLLDVPLIDSPRMTLREIQQGIRTLGDPAVDIELARAEFRNSPVYKNLLTDPEGVTTALLAYRSATPSDTDKQEQMQADVADVRAIIDRYRDDAELHLGGVSMIASDMIDFVRSDIRLFSFVVGAVLLLLLAVTFRQLRWVVIPMLVCAAVVVMMVGWLGHMNWPVTVVSSNFISLTLIITLSLVVHLVVRHQELVAEMPSASQAELIEQTVRSKFAPSVFTSATTAVCFGSLLIANVRPVVDFGLMMVCSVLLALVATLLLYPACVATLPAAGEERNNKNITSRATGRLAAVILQHRIAVVFIYVAVALISAVGITGLGVENRFIDYFSEDTEIYRGMVLIDKKLGGTTPLDVVLDAPASYLEDLEAYPLPAGDGGLSGSSYWYNVFELETVADIHDYLESLPATGKVLSLSSTMAMLTQLNDDRALDNFTLAVMYRRLPDSVRRTLFDPYLSPDGNQVRFSIRVIDSDQNLRRDALLKQIRSELVSRFNLEPEQVKLTGLLVLYNNVLQSLFRSQILTLGAVFVLITLMLGILFRSLRIAVIGVVPTLFAAASILGLMGLFGIPLDIMTITIAAITIGIGVDDTIHYTHRYREELRRDGSPVNAVDRSHRSVGRAIYYTSAIVTLGFSVLAMSNFVPIIYFGLFTGLAMIIALLANLTLLPLLLSRFVTTP